jgi:hypothetical protein
MEHHQHAEELRQGLDPKPINRQQEATSTTATAHLASEMGKIRQQGNTTPRGDKPHRRRRLRPTPCWQEHRTKSSKNTSRTARCAARRGHPAATANTHHGPPPGNPHHPLQRKPSEEPPHAAAVPPRAVAVWPPASCNRRKRTPKPARPDLAHRRAPHRHRAARALPNDAHWWRRGRETGRLAAPRIWRRSGAARLSRMGAEREWVGG